MQLVDRGTTASFYGDVISVNHLAAMFAPGRLFLVAQQFVLRVRGFPMIEAHGIWILRFARASSRAIRVAVTFFHAFPLVSQPESSSDYS